MDRNLSIFSQNLLLPPALKIIFLNNKWFKPMMWTLKNGDITKKIHIYDYYGMNSTIKKEISHGSQTSYILLKSPNDVGLIALI